MAGGDSGLEWDPGKDIQDAVNDPVGTLTGAVVNSMTYGLVGYEDGKFKQGQYVRDVGETIGGLTGRNAARKAAFEAKDATAAAKAASQKERQAMIDQQEANERQLSDLGASQSRRAQGGGNSSAASIEQQLATDFLGL